MKNTDMYDLFFDDFSGSDLPTLDRLLAERRIPTTGNRRHPTGFAAISVEVERAVEIARTLAREGIFAKIVADKYRMPRTSLVTATEIARAAVDRVQRERFPEEDFGPLQFLRENPMWWTFFTPSETLVAKGHIPGGLLCLVDKYDGSVVDGAAQEKAYHLMNGWRETGSRQ